VSLDAWTQCKYTGITLNLNLDEELGKYIDEWEVFVQAHKRVLD
jgi:hypothetical protein